MRTLSRSAAPTTRQRVSRPPPSRRRAPRARGRRRRQAEGMAVAPVGLDQLVEPAAHVAGLEEAGDAGSNAGEATASAASGSTAGAVTEPKASASLAPRRRRPRRRRVGHLLAQLLQQGRLQRGDLAGDLPAAEPCRDSRSRRLPASASHARTFAKRAGRQRAGNPAICGATDRPGDSSPIAHAKRLRRPAKALPRVTSSACSRSAPTGRPLARRVTATEPAQQFGDVQRGRLAGRGRVGREDDLGHPARLDPAQQLGDLQVLGVDPVDRREGAAEHVVEAAVLVGALDRDHVGGLLDHADRRAVAVGVRADPAERALGEVEAALAEADLLLHLADRRRQRPRPPRRGRAGCGRRGAARCAGRSPAAARARRPAGRAAPDPRRSHPREAAEAPPVIPPIFELASS